MSDNLQKFRWLSSFLPNNDEKKLIVVTGARQTGKTTLVKNLYQLLRYINLDAPENRESLRNVKTVNWARDVGNAIIDEAQKEPSVFEKIKFSYDDGKIAFSALLGSAQILLLKKIKESLAGRVFVYELWPLMQSEILTSQPCIPPQPPLFDDLLNTNSMEELLSLQKSVLLPDEEMTKKEAENYLLTWGGMPALLPLDSASRYAWLKSYEYTYLERDLGDLARLGDLEPFRKFQRLAALRSAKLLNYSELAKDSGIAVDTARRYLEYLKLSYQTILLQPYFENLTSSAIKTPKVYFVDIGILRQLIGLTGPATGEVFETYVVGEIFKWIKTCQKRTEMYFYRTRSGLEVDLLLRDEKGILGIEIKSGEKITRSDCRNLHAIAGQLKGQWRGGICIYRGNKLELVAEPNIWAVPSFRLFSS